eukprot:CAMPEP_0205910322 /NCGR_PEP_ID=MMETSP1325-20131115/4363_1 /ASSEMBLY_ACC=CAM_ASM_000708 /TAXON_ID=236786 /ORGANISM="Florenciella sp., Strain RCC1007" /LENGTH=408 /DNA_ID=CAMNT_0053276665 /DNA_START=77 /DNA_END=1303 /DNA_ORIENTATION=-
MMRHEQATSCSAIASSATRPSRKRPLSPRSGLSSATLAKDAVTGYESDAGDDRYEAESRGPRSGTHYGSPTQDSKSRCRGLGLYEAERTVVSCDSADRHEGGARREREDENENELRGGEAHPEQQHGKHDGATSCTPNAPEGCSSGDECKSRNDSMSGWGWFEEEEPDSGAEGGLCRPSPSTSGPSWQPPDHLMCESVSTQALWQVTGGTMTPGKEFGDGEFDGCGAELDGSGSSSMEETENADSLPFRSEPSTPSPDEELLMQADNIYGSAVTKSFYCAICNRISNTVVRIPKFQIVKRGGQTHAEFLVVVNIGSFTFGVWRRYSEFRELAESLAVSKEKRSEFANSLFSWQCLNHRKRWFRCLDKDYLTLKCFLLERFLHDFVYESSEANCMYAFIGAGMGPTNPQ